MLVVPAGGVFLLGGAFLRAGVVSFKGMMGVSGLGNSADASSSALRLQMMDHGESQR
jgi:hypothetical protein